MTDAAIRMNRMYRFQRHIYDATRRPYLVGRSTLINGICPPTDGAVLEIGCGTAWNLVKAAHVYPQARLFGIDVSTVMLQTAMKSISRAGLDNRVQLAHGDATEFSGADLFGISAFDRVILSYTLSMVPAWHKVLSNALAHVGKTGQLHVVDFGEARGLPTMARIGLHAWLDQFDVTPRRELHTVLIDLCQQYSLELYHAELYRGYAQYAVMKRA